MEKTIFPLEKVKILYFDPFPKRGLVLGVLKLLVVVDRIDSRCRRYPRLLQHVGDDVATIQLTRARDMDTDEQSISTVTSGERQQPDTWRRLPGPRNPADPPCTRQSSDTGSKQTPWASCRPSSSCLWRAGGTPRGRGPLRPSQA